MILDLGNSTYSRYCIPWHPHGHDDESTKNQHGSCRSHSWRNSRSGINNCCSSSWYYQNPNATGHITKSIDEHNKSCLSRHSTKWRSNTYSSSISRAQSEPVGELLWLGIVLFVVQTRTRSGEKDARIHSGTEIIKCGLFDSKCWIRISICHLDKSNMGCQDAHDRHIIRNNRSISINARWVC